MYTPARFRVDDESELFDLIEGNSFALLVSGGSPPAITHLPFLLDRNKRCLRTHLARANPHCERLQTGSEATAVFQGPHCYISPGWYVNQDTVPTWNYTAVHITGRVTPVTEPGSLRSLVEELTAHHETAINGQWQLAPQPVERLLPFIQGIEIALDEVQGKFKLSQTRGEPDQRGIIENLERSADPMMHAVAAMMAKQI